MAHKAYFKRRQDTIEAVFTLHRDGVPVTFKGQTFERMPARSGQFGSTNTSWQRGKSPIPLGRHYLWLKPRPLLMTPGGDFFPISSSKSNDRLITNKDGLERWDIGVHKENDKPGSAGCIVLLVDTTRS